tara:strand:- start:1164 stop:1697 length:534 start_codon:yes stop_codon:yes gene_type:complete
MTDNSSIQNVYNWYKFYKSARERWKALYPDHVDENGSWKNICKKCNITTSHFLGWCDKCYNEYTKLRDNYRRKPYNLLKRISLTSECKITGCNKQMLKYHFEKLFTKEMSWDNQSEYWEIDHRIPLCWFDLHNEEEINFACNYKNLQPMIKEENREKKFDYPENRLFDYAFHSSQTS